MSQLVKFSVLVGIRMKSTEVFNVEIGAALLRFNEEAVLYCRGISDDDAHGVRHGLRKNASEPGEGLRV